MICCVGIEDDPGVMTGLVDTVGNIGNPGNASASRSVGTKPVVRPGDWIDTTPGFWLSTVTVADAGARTVVQAVDPARVGGAPARIDTSDSATVTDAMACHRLIIPTSLV